jgi:hypothetical protein
MSKEILLGEEMLSGERQSFHLGGNVIMQGICYRYRKCYHGGGNVIRVLSCRSKCYS